MRDVELCGHSHQAKPVLGRSGTQLLEIPSLDAASVVVLLQWARPSPPAASRSTMWYLGVRTCGSRAHPVPPPPDPGQVTQELPRLVRPLSLNKWNRRMIRHPADPGHAGYIDYLLLTLSQCCITPLSPPSSRFSCVSTSLLPACSHWFSFFIFPSFLVL